jgi:D-inositol-3-phosphate glycosyltransferase
MKIGIISEHASPKGAQGSKDAGGQNIYVAQLALNLARSGHEVEVFTRRESLHVPLVQDLPEGYRLVNVPAGPARHIPKEKLLPYMKDFTQFLFRYFQEEGEVDVIHANFWMSGLVALEVKKKLGIPFAVTFHALGKVRRLHQGKLDSFPDERFSIEDRIVQEADAIIAECPQDREDLITHYQASEEKLTIVPCGFDPEELAPVDRSLARRELGLSENERVILHVGRMVPRKGADNVIRGFGRYVKNSPEKSRLLIVGGESDHPDPKITPEIGRLMSVAHEEGVTDHVQFTGRRTRDRLRTYYSAADVFVTTPWYEPFGITPVEAMACGTPVIGSAVGGIKFTVDHGETGLLIPPNDPDALSEAFGEFFRDPRIRARYSENSLARAHRFFRWDSMACAIEAILNRLISEKPVMNIIISRRNQEVVHAKR